MTWLEAKREAMKMSQYDVSKVVGIAQATYCNIENGKRRPSVETAKKIAAVLGFEWTRFFEDEEAKTA